MCTELLMNEFFDVKPETGYTIGVFGASKRGKSTVLAWLRDALFPDAITILVTPNYQSPVYSAFYGNSIITPNFSTFAAIIPIVQKIQRETKNKNKFLFIIDDVITGKNNRTLHETILTLRNSNISTIISIQGRTLLDPNCRASINAVLVFGTNNGEQVHNLTQAFLIDNVPRGAAGDTEFIKNTAGHAFYMKNMLTGDCVLTECPAAYWKK